MKITELTVSVGRTVNLGNFESFRVDVSARATVTDEDPDALRAEMSAWLKGHVKKAIAEGPP